MAAQKRDLTDRALKALAPAKSGKRSILWDAQVAGFGVRYNDRSPPDRTFVLVTRYPGSKNPAPRAIGEYPTMDLSKARAIARAWREDIAKGIDPKTKLATERQAAERERVEMERRRRNTFSAAFESFFDEHLANLRTGNVVKGVVVKHVYPALGDRPLAEIEREDAKELLRSLSKKTPTNARRILSYLKTFGAWAEDEKLVKDSPFATLRPLTKESARERVLSDLEIRAIWQAAAETGAFGRAVRLMLATGQRRSEVGDAEWREIDEAAQVWTLPRERTKADRGHEVPLSVLATSILSECPKMGSHVFTTRTKRVEKGGRAALETVPLSGWSKAKNRLDELALKALRELTDDPEAEFPEWHLHDLRRTCGTRMAGAGVQRLVISKVLNHAEGGVTQIYDRHGYLSEKRDALDRWATRLKEIVNGRPVDDTPAANVVPFAARG